MEGGTKERASGAERAGQASAGERLRRAVEAALPRLSALDEVESGQPPAPGRWSPREVLGHLVDSATNNHGRFVRAAFQEELVFPGYAQDAWVELQGYRDASWRELVQLFRSLNLHLARVMDALPEPARERPRRVHNLHEIAFAAVPEGQPVTLGWFLHDYVDHLEHHLAEIGAAPRA